jgi:hypothetical protein
MASVKKKEIKKSGNFAVNVQVFGIGIIFSFGQSNKKIESILRLNKIKNMPALLPESDTSPGMTYCNGSTFALVVMREWPDRASKYKTLTHEIFHACDLTLRNIGFKLSDDSHEAWAYMIGDVSWQIFNILWDKKYR